MGAVSAGIGIVAAVLCATSCVIATKYANWNTRPTGSATDPDGAALAHISWFSLTTALVNPFPLFKVVRCRMKAVQHYCFTICRHFEFALVLNTAFSLYFMSSTQVLGDH